MYRSHRWRQSMICYSALTWRHPRSDSSLEIGRATALPRAARLSARTRAVSLSAQDITCYMPMADLFGEE